MITQSPIPKASPVLCNSAKQCLFIPTECLSDFTWMCQVPASVVFVSCPCSFICGSRHNIKMRQSCQGTHGHTETSHFGLAVTQRRLLYPARSCSELSKMFRHADVPHTPQLLPHLLQRKPSRNNDSKFLCHFCIIQVSLHSLSAGSKFIEFALLQQPEHRIMES